MNVYEGDLVTTTLTTLVLGLYATNITRPKMELKK